MKLHRYWIKFDVTEDPYSSHVPLGCGVTAFEYDDALFILKKYVFKGKELPPIEEVIKEVDVSKLDPKHILPNMVGNPAARGVWFPQGFDI